MTGAKKPLMMPLGQHLVLQDGACNTAPISQSGVSVSAWDGDFQAPQIISECSGFFERAAEGQIFRRVTSISANVQHPRPSPVLVKTWLHK